ALTALAAAVNMLGNMASGKCLQKGISAALLLAVGYAAMAIGSFAAFGPWTESSAEWRYAGVLLFSCVGGLVPGTLFSLAVRCRRAVFWPACGGLAGFSNRQLALDLDGNGLVQFDGHCVKCFDRSNFEAHLRSK
ncbi:MAG: hypothetical protein JZU63_09225, partial [Rhodoferax sp.]|nr:hypothetical protein [Rhodoferax sp.]